MERASFTDPEGFLNYVEYISKVVHKKVRTTKYAERKLCN